jgi:hypothetical protein
VTAGHTPGERVAAVLSATKEEVRFLGFGVYVGDEHPPGWSLDPEDDPGLPELRAMVEAGIRDLDAHPFDHRGICADLVCRGEMTREQGEARIAEIETRRAAELARPMEERVAESLDRMGRNPKIVLDDGGIVWGYQCWWCREGEFERFRGGRRIVPASVNGGGSESDDTTG